MVEIIHPAVSAAQNLAKIMSLSSNVPYPQEMTTAPAGEKLGIARRALLQQSTVLEPTQPSTHLVPFVSRSSGFVGSL